MKRYVYWGEGYFGVGPVQFTKSDKDERFLGYTEIFYDRPWPMFGFWFFHIVYDAYTWEELADD